MKMNATLKKKIENGDRMRTARVQGLEEYYQGFTEKTNAIALARQALARQTDATECRERIDHGHRCLKVYGVSCYMD